MKICRECKQEKDESEFYPRKLRNRRNGLQSYGLRSYCKKCGLGGAHKFRLNNPQYSAIYMRKHTHNITIEEYNNLLKLQNHVCAICNQPETSIWRGKVRALAVDHDHKTNKIRGLLCHKCNAGLGMLNDDIKLVQAAYQYLLRYNLHIDEAS